MLITWIQEIKLMLEMHRFDTVFHVTTTLQNPANETYLLDTWGDLMLDQIEAFVELLEDQTQGGADPYDLENLRLSGLAIRDSLGPSLYSRVASLTTADTTGPVYLKTAINQVLFMNASMIHSLSNKLGALCLKDIDGENVATLGEKVTEVAREITGSGNPPSDLLHLVSKPYISGTVDTFKMHALSTHSDVMKGNYG